MAEIRPFRGIRYSTTVAENLGRLLCPPYDVGPARLRELRTSHPYNAIRLEVPEARPGDTLQDNRYTRARDTFQRWLEEGTLAVDPTPAFYLLRQRFDHEGRQYSRLALLTAVRLEDYENGVVLPHEYTMPGPIQDRLSLLRTCRANLSPLMVLYRDPRGRVGTLLHAAAQGEPVVRVRDADGHLSELWVLSDPEVMRAVQRALASEVLYMADGHHRYEAALAYRDEVRPRRGDGSTGSEAYEYAMMGLIAFNDPALLVLPYHRLLVGLQPAFLAKVWSDLGTFFQVSPCHVDGADLPRVLLERVADGAAQRPTIGVLRASDRSAYLLTLRKEVDADSLGPLGPCEGWLLEKALEPALGASLRGHIVYLPDEAEALHRVFNGECQMAFFLRAIPLELFRTIVSQGQRLPPKSTNFYPKLPTGLVFRSLESEL